MPDPSTDPPEKLAETEDTKADQVLDREGVETELMDTDRSDAGERIEGIEEDD